jgi:hypothetical protein
MPEEPLHRVAYEGRPNRNLNHAITSRDYDAIERFCAAAPINAYGSKLRGIHYGIMFAAAIGQSAFVDRLWEKCLRGATRLNHMSYYVYSAALRAAARFGHYRLVENMAQRRTVYHSQTSGRQVEVRHHYEPETALVAAAESGVSETLRMLYHYLETRRKYSETGEATVMKLLNSALVAAAKVGTLECVVLLQKWGANAIRAARESCLPGSIAELVLQDRLDEIARKDRCGFLRPAGDKPRLIVYNWPKDASRDAVEFLRHGDAVVFMRADHQIEFLQGGIVTRLNGTTGFVPMHKMPDRPGIGIVTRLNGTTGFVPMHKMPDRPGISYRAYCRVTRADSAEIEDPISFFGSVEKNVCNVQLELDPVVHAAKILELTGLRGLTRRHEALVSLEKPDECVVYDLLGPETKPPLVRPGPQLALYEDIIQIVHNSALPAAPIGTLVHLMSPEIALVVGYDLTRVQTKLSKATEPPTIFGTICEKVIGANGQVEKIKIKITSPVHRDKITVLTRVDSWLKIGQHHIIGAWHTHIDRKGEVIMFRESTNPKEGWVEQNKLVPLMPELATRELRRVIQLRRIGDAYMGLRLLGLPRDVIISITEWYIDGPMTEKSQEAALEKLTLSVEGVYRRREKAATATR